MPTCWVTFDTLKYDFSPAEKFGPVKFLFPSSIGRDFLPTRAINFVRDAVESGDIQEDDYLIMAGDPTLYAIAVAVLLEQFGKCNVLRWSGKTNDYTPMLIDFDA